MVIALLVVDAQVNMWEAPLHEGSEVLERLRQLVLRARSAGTRIAFVRNVGKPGEVDAIGAPGFAIHPALTPAANEALVDKHNPDAFAGTELAASLREARVDRVVVAGMQSEFCIEATCRGARAAGFEVVLAKGAHSTFDGSRSAVEHIANVEKALMGVAEIQDWRTIRF